MLVFLAFTKGNQALLPHWLDPGAVEKYGHTKCQENRTWQEITHEYASRPWEFETGGLGYLATPQFKVWACFRNHSCLERVPSVQTDSMCYIYDETHKTWLPWILKKQKSLCHLPNNKNSSKNQVRNAHDCARM